MGIGGREGGVYDVRGYEGGREECLMYGDRREGGSVKSIAAVND